MASEKAPVAATVPVTGAAIQNVCTQWTAEFGRRSRAQLEAAVGEYEWAILGASAHGSDEIETLRQQRSSLPALWAAFWRPLPDGTTGGDMAAGVKKLRTGVLGAALARARAARAVLGDVVSLQGDVAVLRDAATSELLRVALQPSMVPAIGRHLRLFGVLVERSDGVWMHPSVILGNRRFAHVSPALLAAQLVRDVRGMGHDPGPLDEACPGPLFLRWAGVAHGLLRRLGEQSEEALLEEERDAADPGPAAHATSAAEALASVGQLLDLPQPSLGAAPRALAASPEGRAAVEAWLRGIERRGLAAPPVYLDLDPVRRALGLPLMESAPSPPR
jgi:hypothetical protein